MNDSNHIKQGNFLFRWRSYLPLLLIIPGFFVFSYSGIIEEKYGDFFEELWVVIGLIIAFLGLFVRWMTVGFVPAGTSGRNTKEQRAKFLNTSGMYSVTKNPLYLGNFLVLFGIFVSLKSLWFIALGCIAYAVYIDRIIKAEELFLIKSFGKSYSSWADKTPRFFPDFSLWQTPSMKFSYKTVLKREYNGVLAVCATFFLTELIIDVFYEKEPFLFWLKEDWPWVALLAFGLATFTTLRTMKRNTNLLKVDGR